MMDVERIKKSGNLKHTDSPLMIRLKLLTLKLKPKLIWDSSEGNTYRKSKHGEI